MVVKVTEKSFQREVCGSPRPVLVEFYASWCPKCAMMQDVLAQFSETHPEIKVCQVDTGEESRLADQYGILYAVLPVQICKSGQDRRALFS